MRTTPAARSAAGDGGTEGLRTPRLGTGAAGFRFDRREISGALADLGVLVAIAVVLIVDNGFSATAVCLPPALLYLHVAWRYRLPVPVQPMKAFAAIAIAQGLDSDAVAAGALVIGVVFFVLGAVGAIDAAARLVPLPVTRGVQLCVGLLFVKFGVELAVSPPPAFADAQLGRVPMLLAAAFVATAAVSLRNRRVMLLLVAAAVVVIAWRFPYPVHWGPSEWSAPRVSPTLLGAVIPALVLPQVVLTFTNSCLATANAAQRYYGRSAWRVQPGRLARSLGLANVVAGAVGGMAVCHGAGGLTAHRSNGARSGGAPLLLGGALLTLALVLGASLPTALSLFPLPILAGVLMSTGLLHATLVRDLGRTGDRGVAVAVGVIGFLGHLPLAIVVGIAADRLRGLRRWPPVFTRGPRRRASCGS